MTEKNKYFVKIETGDVNPTPTHDGGVEYEIEGTYENKLEIESLFHEQHLAGSRAAEYHYRAPFQEKAADEEREQYDDQMINVFRKIYELGTEKTKRQIEEIGILEQQK
ncbi:hypothetical protein [Sediminibacillus massiliensis]|uniref:hypothetical protein n=1 Tax=Sediminibacillus massiliensis TaxID=1926277 RepID=UPI00098850B5|nr:hypothetical protein [Sediminibacillus massiliensis]